MTYELAANVEILFTEHGTGDEHVADRIEAAGAAGLDAVEIWSWRGKDGDRVREALDSARVQLQTMCVDPMGTLVDPATHETFLTALADSAAVAQGLGCPFLVITAGDDIAGVPRAHQHGAIAKALKAAAKVLEPFEVTLLLENLNSRVDHVGTFLDSTAECLEILEEVASPQVRLLYDHYHSLMMGERPERLFGGRHELLGHVQIADVPGRHEPGTGTIDWAHELQVLRDLGYRGRIGLEYLPTVETRTSMRAIRAVVDAFGEAHAA